MGLGTAMIVKLARNYGTSRSFGSSLEITGKLRPNDNYFRVIAPVWLSFIIFVEFNVNVMLSNVLQPFI